MERKKARHIMDVIELERKLEELARLFFEQSSQEIITTKKTSQRLTSNIQDYLENLRIYIEYQKFDLEATRRELQRALEDNQKLWEELKRNH